RTKDKMTEKVDLKLPAGHIRAVQKAIHTYLRVAAGDFSGLADLARDGVLPMGPIASGSSQSRDESKLLAKDHDIQKLKELTLLAQQTFNGSSEAPSIETLSNAPSKTVQACLAVRD